MTEKVLNKPMYADCGKTLKIKLSDKKYQKGRAAC